MTTTETKNDSEISLRRHVSPETLTKENAAYFDGLDLTIPENLTKWRAFRNLWERKTEPLLDPANNRDALYPIRFPAIWDFYKKHQAMHWIAEEIILTVDINDWRDKLTEDERFFIKHTLAFFAGSDFIVVESQQKDHEDFTPTEWRFF